MVGVQFDLSDSKALLVFLLLFQSSQMEFPTPLVTKGWAVDFPDISKPSRLTCDPGTGHGQV